MFRRIFVAVMALLVVVVAPLAFILYPTLKPYPEMDFPPAGSQAEETSRTWRISGVCLRSNAVLRRKPAPHSYKRSTRWNSARPDLEKASMAMGAAKAVAIADNGHPVSPDLSAAMRSTPFRFASAGSRTGCS